MLCGEPGRTRTFSVLKINQAVNQTVGLKMFFNLRKDSNLLSPDDRRAVYQTVGGLLAPVVLLPRGERHSIDAGSFVFEARRDSNPLSPADRRAVYQTVERY